MVALDRDEEVQNKEKFKHGNLESMHKANNPGNQKGGG